MRVRTRKWERLYRMRAQSGGVSIRYLRFSLKDYIFFFFSSSNCYHLRNRDLIYRWLMAGVRKGEKKSRISCDPFESAEKIGGWWKETNTEFSKRYEIWIEFHVSNENSKLHFWRKNCYSGGGMSFIWI